MEAQIVGGRDEERVQQFTVRLLVQVRRDVQHTSGHRHCPSEAHYPVKRTKTVYELIIFDIDLSLAGVSEK